MLLPRQLQQLIHFFSADDVLEMTFDSIVSFMDPACHCNHSQSPLTFRVNLNKAQDPVVQKNDDNTTMMLMKRHELSCLQNCGRKRKAYYFGSPISADPLQSGEVKPPCSRTTLTRGQRGREAANRALVVLSTV